MKTCKIVAGVLVAMLLFGCAGAKFQQEKTLLTTVATAMETLTASINQAGTPQAVTSAVSAFSTEIEKVAPAMKQLSDAHPDWDTNPPAELKDTMEKFKTASSGFQSAMPKLMEMASQYPDDADLQNALQKFQSVVEGL